jgi:two-component system, sensor histidine kinase and response regulator
MDEYLTKPLNAELLQAMLKKMIGWKPEPAPVAAAPQPDQELENPPINLTDLLTRCLGNFDFALSMLDELETSSGERLEAIRRAADQQDLHATAEVAHSLKGVAGILCAKSVQQAAAEVEATARTGNLAEIGSLVDNMTRELRQCMDSLPTLRQELQVQQRQASQT